MTIPPVNRRRAFSARLLVPLIVALGSLPLMAPTCGSSGEGVKVFSRRSLIIPMDVCYQYMPDGIRDGVRSWYTPIGGTTECPAVDSGDVVKAYGLVYQLIRNGIAVYWVIDNTKTKVTDVDLTVQYDNGFPVFLYDWATGVEGAAPRLGGTGHLINYRGGPFVVDGSDFDRASAILQSFRATFGAVNVHVANVAFRGYSKRTMAGGWSAGGTVPPKLALLDIGSGTDNTGHKNSEIVIRGYLTRAGLDTPGAMGYADPRQGAHGEIFDRLFLPDFLGTPASSDWTTSRLVTNGYQILWVPHWMAPTSCKDCPPSTSCTCAIPFSDGEIQDTLANIGSWVTIVNSTSNTRGDLFAECAGLGSFEGVFGASEPSTLPTPPNLSYSPDYVVAGAGEPSTHFETESSTTQQTGLWINKSVSSAKYLGSFSSPLMQIGDYPFIPRTGAIQNFKANRWKGEVVHLISEATSPTYDIFSMVPAQASGAAPHGTIVYMGGHSYSGTDGAFEVAGTRLVLNTLFNLGASCTAAGVPCQSGLLGVCAAGHYVCAGGPDPVCVPDLQPGQNAEICNGLDDDCDGQVDEGLQTECYEPPTGFLDPAAGHRTGTLADSKNFGVCRPGIKVCQQNVDGSYGMSACTGQVLPVAEACNGLDDDCDGRTDDFIAARDCYDGPPSTRNIGECKPGAQVCRDGQWGGPDGVAFQPGVCAGEVLPRAEVCADSGGGNAQDEDCDGRVNNGCTCTADAIQGCFPGPGTAGWGTCRAGTQICKAGGFWDNCGVGATTAAPITAAVEPVVATTSEACVRAADWTANNCAGYPGDNTCSTFDTNCDHLVVLCPECSAGDTRACPDGALPALPAGSSYDLPPPSQCRRGIQHCDAATGRWAASCTGTILPATDREGPIEYCDGRDNDCDGLVDEDAICPVGDACVRGVCVPATCGTELTPPEGYACSAGVDPGGSHTTIAGLCGGVACDVGELCRYGNCVDPCPVSSTQVDPDTLLSVSLVCGRGTVCGGGACLGGNCYEWDAGCPSTTTVSGQPQKQLCLGGACKADLCDGKLCPSSTFCRLGDCVQACTFVTCYAGEKCGTDGFCEPDPCAGKLCGAGQKCTNGTCARDPCLGIGCAVGQVCVADGNVPSCVDDPCTGVVCPAGACAAGQCFRAGNLTGEGTASRTAPEAPASKGCGCGSGTDVAFPALLALLAAPLLRRRRRAGAGGRGALLLVLVSVALVGSACKEKKTEAQFDPSTCAAVCEGEVRCIDFTSDPSHCGDCGKTCNAGDRCVDGACGRGDVAPELRSLAPTSGAKDQLVAVTLSGARFGQTASVRVEIGGTTWKTIPCSATPGGACTWQSAGALLVNLNLAGASPKIPWALRVVNPDGVISEDRPFGIAIPTPALVGVAPSAVAAGTITKLVVSGTGFTTGSSCRIATIPGMSGPQALLTPVMSGNGAQLECTLDATAIPAGSYTLTVVSEPDGSGVSRTSNGLALTVSPSDPVIASIDPNAIDPGVASTLAGFLVSGARFDPRTAQVLFYRGGEAALAPQYVTTLDQGSILVHGLPVGAGTAYPANIYTVAVRNGSGASARTSNTVSFIVGASAAPVINGFTPPWAYQGDVGVPLTFSGANLDADQPIVIQLQRPGSTTFTAASGSLTPSCSGTCTVSAPVSFAGEPEGSWYARLRFASGATSAPWPLLILSNQAILRDYTASPDPAQAGTVGGRKDAFTFSVSNLRSANVRIALFDPTGATTVALLTPTSISPALIPTTAISTITVTGNPALSFVNYDAGTYTFRAVNPGALPSNALPFAINAGFPTLSSVCVAGTSCTRYAIQGDPVTIRLTGTNFAKPDTSGNGSVVVGTGDFGQARPASPTAADFPSVDPCDVLTTTHFRNVPVVAGTTPTVIPTTIDVQIDTLSAYVDPSWGTTYYVGVWNPGGPTGLQKSSCGKTMDQLRQAGAWFRICAKRTGTTCTQ